MGKWTSSSSGAGVIFVAMGCCGGGGAAATPAQAGPMMERRADCSAKSVLSAKRTTDREARKAVEDPLSEFCDDDVCAVEKSSVVVDDDNIVVLLVDERGESWARTGGKLDRWVEWDKS